MKIENVKVGDRVSGDWYNPNAQRFERVRGYFDGLSAYGDAIRVSTDKRGFTAWLCAPNSIRKLVPKKRLEFWVKPGSTISDIFIRGPILLTYPPSAEQIKSHGPFIHMVEKRPKK